MKIAAAAAAASALLFALVLIVTYLTMLSLERRASADLLQAPMNEVVGSLRSGEPLDEEVGAADRVTVVVFAASGTLSFRSGTAPVGKWGGSGEMSLSGRKYIYRTVSVGSRTVVAAVDWTQALARLERMRLVFAILLLPFALIVGLAAYVAAGLMYRPLRKLTFAAKAMATEGKIGQLDDPGDPDFTPLAQEINALLHRISSEVERQERLVSDVAHDLRTPLTVIRGRLETALMQANTVAYPAAMQTAIAEAERLSVLADSILTSGIQPEVCGAVELSEPLKAAILRWEQAFEQRGGNLEATAENCFARIGEDEWNSILDNLIDNAFKYGGSSCKVSLSVGKETVLTVRDDGPGIPAPDRMRVFERFVQLDPSRSSKGHGLGLFLCAAAVSRRGGTIAVLDEPGMAVCIRLPKAASPAG